MGIGLKFEFSTEEKGEDLVFPVHGDPWPHDPSWHVKNGSQGKDRDGAGGRGAVLYRLVFDTGLSRPIWTRSHGSDKYQLCE